MLPSLKAGDLESVIIAATALRDLKVKENSRDPSKGKSVPRTKNAKAPGAKGLKAQAPKAKKVTEPSKHTNNPHWVRFKAAQDAVVKAKKLAGLKTGELLDESFGPLVSELSEAKALWFRHVNGESVKEVPHSDEEQKEQSDALCVDAQEASSGDRKRARTSSESGPGAGSHTYSAIVVSGNRSTSGQNEGGPDGRLKPPPRPRGIPKGLPGMDASL